MKIHPVRADLFYVAGHTGRDDKAIVTFCSFLNVTKNCLKNSSIH